MSTYTFGRFARAPQAGVVATLLQWSELARQRRQLRRLDHNSLKDLGIDPSAARAEAARPFWDVPAGWKQ